MGYFQELTIGKSYEMTIATTGNLYDYAQSIALDGFEDYLLRLQGNLLQLQGTMIDFIAIN